VGPQEPKVAEVLLLPYLHGRSTGDFAPALEGFVGSAAGHLVAPVRAGAVFERGVLVEPPGVSGQAAA
jgi:hypothetical protein